MPSSSRRLMFDSRASHVAITRCNTRISIRSPVGVMPAGHFAKIIFLYHRILIILHLMLDALISLLLHLREQEYRKLRYQSTISNLRISFHSFIECNLSDLIQ